MKRKLLLIILLSLFLPFSSRAAILYLEPSSGSYHQGDTFVVSLRIDTEKDCINTVEGQLNFSQDILEALDFSQGNSLLTLWVNPPLINQAAGIVSFTGGIPGGYCGRISGDPGESNLLGRIVFKAKTAGNGQLKISDTSQVLLNDGLGTLAELERKEAVFTILTGASEVSKQEWQEERVKDNLPPEIFKIEINQDPLIFEGKYFITFSTTDKQTGLDYYEVREGEGRWRRTVSPCLLEDQGLRSIIEVRAVDKAGNALVVEHQPTSKPTPSSPIVLAYILMAIGLIYGITRKLNFKK